MSFTRNYDCPLSLFPSVFYLRLLSSLFHIFYLLFLLLVLYSPSSSHSLVSSSSLPSIFKSIPYHPIPHHTTPGHSSTPRRASLPGEGFVRNGGKGCPYHTLGTCLFMSLSLPDSPCVSFMCHTHTHTLSLSLSLSLSHPLTLPPTYFQSIGIDYNSSERQIKLAYRKLALRYHPDKNRDAGAEELFKNVTTAYTLLTDEVGDYMWSDIWVLSRNEIEISISIRIRKIFLCIQLFLVYLFVIYQFIF